MRPDQHIARVLPVAGHEERATYFARFKLEADCLTLSRQDRVSDARRACRSAVLAEGLG